MKNSILALIIGLIMISCVNLKSTNHIPEINPYHFIDINYFELMHPYVDSTGNWIMYNHEWYEVDISFINRWFEYGSDPWIYDGAYIMDEELYGYLWYAAIHEDGTITLEMYDF